jgi:cellulase/cellobiase CelA1
MQKLRRFVAHWKLLVVPIAVVAVGLAIALPINMASARGSAGSNPALSDRAEHRVPARAAHAAAEPGCVVTYTARNWPGAFTAKVTVSNRRCTSINGWTLTFRFAGDEAISSAWNASFTQTGAEVSASNLNFDGTIAPGASQSLGFLGAWTSNATAPADFRVNHAACTAHS